MKAVSGDLPNRLLRWLVGLLVSLRIHHLLKASIRFMPPQIQQWMQRQRLKILVRLKSKYEIVPAEKVRAKYDAALALLKDENGDVPIGDYLEFGVYQGTSLTCMHNASKAAGLTNMRLIGFDSFQGLPDEAVEDDDGVWRPGQFSSEYEYTQAYLNYKGVDWDRVILVKGWYRDTLNQDTIKKHNITNASVIMMDCDMYLSAKEALEFCAPLIQDRAIIFFDDWNSNNLAAKNMGEKRAFDEFLQDNEHLIAEELVDFAYNSNVQVFIVTKQTESSEAYYEPLDGKSNFRRLYIPEASRVKS